jgi:porin
LALRDPLPDRKADTLALGFGIAEIGAGAVGFSADSTLFNAGAFTPRRDYEAVLEATYQYQATPWAQIQPDLQYVRSPGGGLADPSQPRRKIGDALVAGVRVNLTF